jgi:hypothetical protein
MLATAPRGEEVRHRLNARPVISLPTLETCQPWNVPPATVPWPSPSAPPQFQNPLQPQQSAPATSTQRSNQASSSSHQQPAPSNQQPAERRPLAPPPRL